MRSVLGMVGYRQGAQFKSTLSSNQHVFISRCLVPAGHPRGVDERQLVLGVTSLQECEPLSWLLWNWQTNRKD